MKTYPYVYKWKNNPSMGLKPCPKRVTLYGRFFLVVARGQLNSALIEFENGQREIVSRNVIRKRV